jgi:hypothetical protein
MGMPGVQCNSRPKLQGAWVVRMTSQTVRLVKLKIMVSSWAEGVLPRDAANFHSSV